MEILANSTIRELSPGEINEVSGGILPIIGFGLALASHVGVGTATTTIVGHAISGVALGIASFSLARYFGGGRRRYRRSTKSL